MQSGGYAAPPVASAQRRALVYLVHIAHRALGPR